MRTITVKGVGSVSAKPDYINISLKIDTLERDYDIATEKAAVRINNIEQALQKIGFTKGSLKTMNFNVSASYKNINDNNGNYRHVFVGYSCSYRLKLAFDFDSKRLAEVISAIAESKSNPELNIDFTVKNASNISEELLISATKNAKEKAEILCRASGTRLGDLQSIDYNWGELNIISPTIYDIDKSIMPKMAMSKCASIDIEPDDIDVRDTAAFIWEII